MAEDDDIYDIAPTTDEKVVSFRALKDTWNVSAAPITMSTGKPPTSPPPKSGGGKPFLPQKKGPPISLESVMGAKNRLNVVPTKRESATRGSKIAIPDAFAKGTDSSKPNKPPPRTAPKPEILRKPPTQNGNVPNGQPQLPSKSNRKTLDPLPRQQATPTSTPLPPKQTPPKSNPTSTTKTVSSDTKENKSPQGQPKQDQRILCANGQKFRLLSLPAARGVGPIKPSRPPEVCLPMGEIVGEFGDDDELYDEVGAMVESSPHKPRSSLRPVSVISEYTEEEEDNFEQKPPLPAARASASASLIDDEDLYDTVEDLKAQDEDDQLYDDDMVMNSARDSTTGSLYEAFDDIIETYSQEQKNQVKKTMSSGNKDVTENKEKAEEPDELDVYDDVENTNTSM